MQEQNYKFSEGLKSLLKEKNISGAELGRRVGVSKEAISKYCKGHNIPKTSQLLKIAEYFGVSPEYLLTGVEPQDKEEHQELSLSGEAIRLLKQYQDEGVFNFINELLSDPRFYSLLSDALKYKAIEGSIFAHFNEDPKKAIAEIMDYFDDKDRGKANLSVFEYLNAKFMNKTGFGLIPVFGGFKSLLDLNRRAE